MTRQTPILLFFDTETTGLPRSYNAPITNVANWPRLVQLSWIITNAEGEKINSSDYIIKPDRFIIPEQASAIHGITTEKACSQGCPIEEVLTTFLTDVATADYVIGHNVDFDKKIVGAELVRLHKQPNLLIGKKSICTMQQATKYCKIKNQYGYKYPKLEELHYYLFGHSFEGAHNALRDVETTVLCFFEMRKRGLISL